MKYKNKMIVLLTVLMIISIAYILTGVILIKKENKVKKETKTQIETTDTPIVIDPTSTENVDNQSSKLKEIHQLGDIVINNVNIIKRGDTEAVTGYVSNQGLEDIKNLKIEVSVLDANQNIMNIFELEIDSLKADKQENYFEHTLSAVGLISADDYSFVIK